MSKGQFQIWTIGHSTRTSQEFLELLHANEIAVLADVRRFTGSRKYPHFNQEPLNIELGEAGIEYIAFPDLGGRRKPRADSHNTIWKNDSFRGYADYMETGRFEEAIEKLSELAGKSRTAIMCAEAVWWRCHRALIADYLKSRGAEVFHIMSISSTVIHPYTSAARFSDGKLSYSADSGTRRT